MILFYQFSRLPFFLRSFQLFYIPVDILHILVIFANFIFALFSLDFLLFFFFLQFPVPESFYELVGIAVDAAGCKSEDAVKAV